MAKFQGFKATALYERLSKDDELQGESNSILNGTSPMTDLPGQTSTGRLSRRCSERSKQER